MQKARAQNLPINRDAGDATLQLAREAIAIDPNHAGAHASLASVLMQRIMNGLSERPDKDRAAAFAAVERAGEWSAENPVVLRALGNVLSNCGEHDKAGRSRSPFRFS